MISKEDYPVVDFAEEMRRDYYEYGMYTVTDRAIPNLYDNMKPIQRKIMATMWKHKVSSRDNYKKCVKLIGLTASLSTHGDTSIYGAMVRMAQDFKNNMVKMDPSGIVGWVDGSSASSARYLEMRLSEYAEQGILKDLSKETTDWIPNYDETEEEPVVIPAVVPDILINGNLGIAVGFLTSTVPHNPKEVTKLLLAYIENRNLSLQEMMKLLPAPDFPTGGIINGIDGIRRAYETGVGSVIVRSRVKREEANGRECIVITEIPFDTTTTKIIEDIADIGDKKELGIRAIRDESSRGNGIRIVVELDKEEDYDRALNYLYKNSSVQSRININQNVLDGKQLITVTLPDIIHKFVSFREDVIHKRLKAEMRRNGDRIHILEGLLLCRKQMDNVISTIRSSKGRDDSKKKLMSQFRLSETQAGYIVDLRLYRLSNMEMDLVEKEKDQLVQRQKVLTIWTATKSNQHIDAIMVEEWRELLTGIFKDCHRKTEIIQEAEHVDVLSTIKEEDLTLVTTQKNFIKLFPGIQEVPQRKEDWKMDSEDGIREVLHLKSTDTVVWITDTGHVFSTPIYQLLDIKGTRGKLLRNIVDAKPYANLCRTIVVQPNRNVITVKSDGMVKATSMSMVEKIQPAGRVIHEVEKGKTRIVAAFSVGEQDDIFLVGSKGNGIRFPHTDIRNTGLGGLGVRGMKLRGDEVLVDAVSITPQDTHITVGTVRGGIKRYESTTFRTQSRGGLGVMVSPTDDVMGDICSVVTGDPIFWTTAHSKHHQEISDLRTIKSKSSKWEAPLGVIPTGVLSLWSIRNYINITTL